MFCFNNFCLACYALFCVVWENAFEFGSSSMQENIEFQINLSFVLYVRFTKCMAWGFQSFHFFSIAIEAKVCIFYWDLSIMLRLNWQDNFKFPTQRLSQIMRDFGLRVICLIRLKIILPSLNLFLGADKSISVMKLRNKWFLAKLHSFIGVCKISYIKHVLSTKKSPLQLSASS